MSNLHIPEHLEAAAAQHGLTAQQLVEQVLTAHIEAEFHPPETFTDAQIARFKESIAQLDRGERIPAEEIDEFSRTGRKRLTHDEPIFLLGSRQTRSPKHPRLPQRYCARPGSSHTKALRKAFNGIAESPYLGAQHSTLTRLLGTEVRSRLSDPYRIFYRLDRAAPEIFAILHTARDIPTILADRLQ